MNLDEVERYFKEKLDAFGNTAQGMDWKNQESQYVRFSRIADLIAFDDNPSVLDVGCGTSEFFEYCRINGFLCNYHGIDIVPEMVEIANQRFEENVASVGNALALPEDTTYDYVIASGTFNAKLNETSDQWEVFFHQNIAAMFKACNKALIFNCMTPHVDWEYDRLYYPDLTRLTSFIVKHLSRRFKIDHSYDLYEMTVSVEKTL